MLRDFMRLGMDVARLNFSHGTHEEHARVIERVRKVAKHQPPPLPTLQHQKGQKIRPAQLNHPPQVALRAGPHTPTPPRNPPGTATLIATTFKTLSEEVEPGARILLADGLIELRV